MHLKPDPAVDGHFNVLRGALGGNVQRAGVKVVSDFVYNYEHGLHQRWRSWMQVASPTCALAVRVRKG